MATMRNVDALERVASLAMRMASNWGGDDHTARLDDLADVAGLIDDLVTALLTEAPALPASAQSSATPADMAVSSVAQAGDSYREQRQAAINAAQHLYNALASIAGRWPDSRLGEWWTTGGYMARTLADYLSDLDTINVEDTTDGL